MYIIRFFFLGRGRVTLYIACMYWDVTATVEMDMTAPGTLSLATATTVLMSKGEAVVWC